MSAFNYNLKKQGGKGCHNLGLHAWLLVVIKAHTRKKEKNEIREDCKLSIPCYTAVSHDLIYMYAVEICDRTGVFSQEELSSKRKTLVSGGHLFDFCLSLCNCLGY